MSDIKINSVAGQLIYYADIRCRRRRDGRYPGALLKEDLDLTFDKKL